MVSNIVRTQEKIGNILKFGVIPRIVRSGCVEIRGLVLENTDMVIGSMLRASGFARLCFISKIIL